MRLNYTTRKKAFHITKNVLSKLYNNTFRDVKKSNTVFLL